MRRAAWGLLLAATAGICTPAAGQSWSRFRGPNGAGVSSAHMPSTWNNDDYRWRAALPGVGHSSPVLWEDRIFLTSGDEETGRRIVLCLHTADGRVLWQRAYTSDKHGKHALNSFASSTPAVDARRVYACWATPEEFVVLALDHAGNESWRVDLGPYKAGHGFGVSPIVYEDLLIVPNDQDGDSSLVALETASGKIRWQVPRQTLVTYSTPCIFQPPDRPAELIVTNWNYGIEGIDPRSGKTLWQAKVFGPDDTETAIGSPVIAGDIILGVSGWLTRKKRCVAVRTVSENGQLVAREVYRFERGAPLSTTPLVVGDLLFLWADEGIVTCADVQTGQTHWMKRVGGTYYGSPVAAGGNVYCLSASGECVVLRAAPEFEEVGRIDLGEPSHSTPAIAGNTMYLRTFSHLMALDGKPAAK